jgi:amino acid transporter, AAT family
MTHDEDLQRGLGERHINMIAVGSAIGVGLFLGSAGAIRAAGPAILLAYALCGAAILFIVRSLGELAVAHPVAGSFGRYAHVYLGPLAGFITGWTYWFLWAADGMAEVTAVALYMKMWYPTVPGWIWAFSALLIMPPFNLIAVRAFGEFEFWISLIKILTVVLMIAVGLGMIVAGWGNHGVATGISNLWRHGGVLPHGVTGWLTALPMVAFAYVGIEIVGTTAGEARDPERTLSRAVNTIFWRVLLFYVGALFVILSVFPWNAMTDDMSPFVIIFAKLGVPSAAGVINFVLLTTALSAINGGLFSNGRMLYNLAQQKQAPAIFARVSRVGIPVHAVLVSVATLLVGVLLNYFAPQEVFVWLTAIATFGAIWTWAVILASHYRFRRRAEYDFARRPACAAPFFPYGSIFAGAFLALVVVVMMCMPDTRIAVIVGPLWIAVLTLAFYACGHHRVREEAAVAREANEPSA